MLITDHIAELDRQGRALAVAGRRADLDAWTPTCPGWRIRDLIGHLGGVHRWATSFVQTGRAADPKFPPPPTDGLLDWFVAGHSDLVDALTRAPTELDCWTFLPAPSPLAFWARRQAHETAIHRADTELAAGGRPVFPAEFAADGIDELMAGYMVRRGRRLVSEPPRSLLIAPNDSALRWHLTVTAEHRDVRFDNTLPADCTAAGTASDLYLMLWNRLPSGAADVTGDPAILELWREFAHAR